MSVTVALSGCDLFKSEAEIKTEKIARLDRIWEEKSRKFREAQAKRNEAERKRDELKAQLDKEYSSVLDYIDTEEFTKRCNEAIEANEEADKAFGESCKAWDKLSPYLPQHEFDTRNY
ncbi:hypothetical protein [Candidatus Liberibacter solanacearum]|uniref:Uncharacterized protein n=1 Tax=Candidatus Liberibacter solanacearum TaxID=556287 RepID=A0A1V2N715_9HYPH|nr:hypothetical protein [Candidatus Liberibacter solanacearum]ONI58605.1 hypothetical protein AYO25_04815 [Candidatus Liberibacter solanacearum]